MIWASVNLLFLMCPKFTVSDCLEITEGYTIAMASDLVLPLPAT